MKALIASVLVLATFSALAYAQQRIQNPVGRFQLVVTQGGGVYRIDTMEAHLWYCGVPPGGVPVCIAERSQ